MKKIISLLLALCLLTSSLIVGFADQAAVISSDEIVETKVEAIVLRAEGTYVKLECNSVYETSLKRLGRTWWLTLEDAETWVEKNNKKIL